MTHTINNDRTAAVSHSIKWLPIDANTPRGVTVNAIARHTQGLAKVAKLAHHETFGSTE